MSLLGRISMIKIKVLLRMMFLFCVISTLSTVVRFKQWQKIYLNLCGVRGQAAYMMASIYFAVASP